MNILQIRSAFEDSGPGSQTLTISEELKRRGHEVMLCCGGGMLTEKITNSGFKLHIIPEMLLEKRSPLNVFKSIFKLKKLLKKQNIDVVHAHNAATLYQAYFAALLNGRTSKTKFFHSCRGVELRPKYQWRNWIYKVYPARVFAVCEFTKSTLISFGVKPSKITVTFNGVDLNRFDIQKVSAYRKEIREEYKIPSSATVVGIIGRMYVKGHDLLIKAFSRLYKKYPDLYIICVGVGPKYESNIQLAKDLDVHDRTIFTGFRTDAEKLNAAFDVFALLSTWGEMFPNAILESMAYAHPFVASRLSGIPEMAEHGEGLLSEVNDLDDITEKLEHLITNPQLRQQMGAKARLSIEQRFNIEKVVDTIEHAYNN